jgi:hypothetical protein
MKKVSVSDVQSNTINIDKTIRSYLVNTIHFIDAYICYLIILSFIKKGYRIHTIHDSFGMNLQFFSEIEFVYINVLTIMFNENLKSLEGKDLNLSIDLIRLYANFINSCDMMEKELSKYEIDSDEYSRLMKLIKIFPGDKNTFLEGMEKFRNEKMYWKNFIKNEN